MTETDIADAMRKLGTHEREHEIEDSHVFGHVERQAALVAKVQILN